MKNNLPRLLLIIACLTALSFSTGCASFGDAMAAVAAEGNQNQHRMPTTPQRQDVSLPGVR